MGRPAFPKAAEESGWKKAAAADAGTANKAFAAASAVRDEAENALPDRDLKALDELEAAIKSRQGGAVVQLYQTVGDTVCPRIDQLQKLAGKYADLCKKAAAQLPDDKKDRAAVDWLQHSGPALVAYARDLQKFADQLLADAEKIPREQITDFEWELNDWDLAHLLVHNLGLHLRGYALPGKLPVSVTISGKAGASALGNATLRAQFFESAFQAGKVLAPHLGERLEDIDSRLLQGRITAHEVPRLVQAELADFESRYRQKADAAAQKIWADLNKDREDYRKYELHLVADVGKKVGGIVVSIVTLATAGWTGVGTVMGVAGALKESVELANALADGILSARGLAQKIRASLLSLQHSYKSAWPTGAQEVGKDVLARLTGLKMDTVASVQENLRLYENKLKGCNVKGTDLGARIDTALRESDALHRKLQQAQAQLAHVKKVDFAALTHKHEQVMKSVGRLVEAAARYQEDYRDGLNALAVWGRQLKALDAQVPEVAKGIQKWVVPLVDFAFVSDLKEAEQTASKLRDEYIAKGEETLKEMIAAHEAGELAGDPQALAARLIGN